MLIFMHVSYVCVREFMYVYVRMHVWPVHACWMSVYLLHVFYVRVCAFICMYI
jgi:hypothetical protein